MKCGPSTIDWRNESYADFVIGEQIEIHFTTWSACLLYQLWSKTKNKIKCSYCHDCQQCKPSQSRYRMSNESWDWSIPAWYFASSVEDFGNENDILFHDSVTSWIWTDSQVVILKVIWYWTQGITCRLLCIQRTPRKHFSTKYKFLFKRNSELVNKRRQLSQHQLEIHKLYFLI